MEKEVLNLKCPIITRQKPYKPRW